MLIEQGWQPGVWIDGQPAHATDAATDTADAFGTFAHRVHGDLLAARDAGRIPAHVETTISASTITPLWGDDAPIALMLHIRFTGLADPTHAATRDEVITEAVASLDHRGAEHLPPDHVDKYGGALFFVDDHDRPQDTRMHTLRP
jgi:hypothetical protein